MNLIFFFSTLGESNPKFGNLINVCFHFFSIVLKPILWKLYHLFLHHQKNIPYQYKSKNLRWLKMWKSIPRPNIMTPKEVTTMVKQQQQMNQVLLTKKFIKTSELWSSKKDLVVVVIVLATKIITTATNLNWLKLF